MAWLYTDLDPRPREPIKQERERAFDWSKTSLGDQVLARPNLAEHLYVGIWRNADTVQFTCSCQPTTSATPAAKLWN
jgi:hypothetical protein